MNRGERERLPDRRAATSAVSAVIEGHRVHVHTATYADGRLAEVFIRTRSSDPVVRGLLAVLGLTASIALQYGMPLSEIVDAWTWQKFEPHGPVAEHDRLRMCSSLVDYVGRELGIQYMGRDDLAHVATAEVAVP